MNNAQFYYLLRRGVFGGGITPLVRNFGERINADGGVYEKLNCVQRAISTLPAGPSFEVFTFERFNERVVADGGSTESAVCTQNSLKYLNANFTI
jgi:cephalosporin-C deacetylase-like acetyl esterase